MILIHKDQRIDIQSMKELETCWNQIQQEASKNNEIPYYLHLNGLEIYDDIYQTLQENFTTDPLEIELITINQEQLLAEVRKSLEEYLSRVLSQIEPLADPFYGEVSSEHWNSLGVLLEGLEWMLQSWSGLLHTFPASFQQHALAIQQTFEQVTRQLLKEMEMQNHTGIGDCLLYELQPLLEEMQQIIRGTGA